MPEIQSLRSIGALLAVPLRAKAEIVGILLLGAPTGRTEYSAVDKRILRSCAGQFALMIENGRLTGRIVEQEKLRRDVQLAAEVQRRLFPDQFPESTAGTLTAASLPARSVGGDYYDFFDLGEGRIGIALADVAGKGVAAALIMSVVQASLRIIASEDGVSLASATAKLNRFLYRSTRSSSYATFFYAQLDARSRQLRYVNAGHNPPYLLRVGGPGETGTIDELSTGGTIIGMFPQMSYEEAVVDLQPGDVLLIFTDGVPEALSPAEEEFGEDRLRDLLQRVAHFSSVDEMAAHISQELRNWIDDAEQYDDLTFILVKVK
jgi:phosphoserine phosphatase RsbU/P